VRRISPHAGFTAPIGIAWNFGHASESKRFLGLFDIGSTSLFVPIVDLGAVAAWRIGNGSGQLATVQWSNVVAPGIFMVWSAKDRPYSIMIGTQYGPELRSVSTSSGATIQRAAWQLPAINLTFDIPIFNLYERSRPGSP
jgi:hypothetical protein